MLHVAHVTIIFVPAVTIWRLISDFGAGSLYLALVTQCIVQGKGTGALRTLTYADGSVIVERLETVDETAYCLSYTVLSDTSFGSCRFSLALSAQNPDQAELTWTADFQPAGLPADEAVALMEGMLADNCQALKQVLER